MKIKCPISSSFQVTLASVFAKRMQCSFNAMHFYRGHLCGVLRKMVPGLGQKIAIGAQATLGARKIIFQESLDLKSTTPWTLQVGSGTP